MDHDALANALYKMYSDPKTRESMGAKGKEIITNYYKVDSQMKTVYNVIKSIIK